MAKGPFHLRRQVIENISKVIIGTWGLVHSININSE
jgi:hypothetical protein